MATDIDDVLEQLLFDVAIAGRRGLGAAEIEDVVTSQHDHQQTLAASSTHRSVDDTIITPPTDSLDTLIDTVWQRLEQHPDITVETPEGYEITPLNGGGQQAACPSKALVPQPSRVYASEERIWQAIAGHGVDHKRISPIVFDILEVVAAAGPDGILQPEARKLTDQDKQSIPIRTDRLADRGYITKEKVAVPKMITSRLRLWRFSSSVNSAPSDPTWDNTDKTKGGYIDHMACFDSIVQVLQSSNGIAMLEDIRQETDCASQLKRKALARCIDRLERRGMLRRIKAKVEDEKNLDGTDRFARCLQLLRDPTGQDREAAMGSGGPVKLDENGRPNAKSRVRRENGVIHPTLLDGATDQPDGNDPEIAGEPRQHALEQEQPLAFGSDDSSPVTYASEFTQHIDEESRIVAKSPQGSTASLVDAPASADHSSRKKRRISLDGLTRSKMNLTQPIPALSAGSDAAISGDFGVFFTTPPRTEKRKVGRPKKSLIAVFKSPMLRDKYRLSGGTTTAEEPLRPTAASGTAILNQQASNVTQDNLSTPQTEGPPTFSTTELADTPAVPCATFVNHLEQSNKPTKSVDVGAETVSNHTLGQRRRREKERAKKALIAAAAPEQVGHPPPAAELNLAVVSAQNDSETPSKRSLGQRKRFERERANRALAGATAAQQSGNLKQPDATDHFVDTLYNELPANRKPLITKMPLAHDSLQQFEQTQDQAIEHASTQDIRLATATLNTSQNDPTGSAASSRRTAEEASIVSPPAVNISNIRHDQTSMSLSPQAEFALPQLNFVPFESEDEGNPAAPTRPARNKRTIDSEGPTHTERFNAVMDIVGAAHGVFPGAKEMKYPFVTLWTKTHSATPDLRTVGRTVETLRRNGKLHKYEFRCPNGKGSEVMKYILLKSDIDPSSEQVKRVQRKMMDVMPDMYMPDEIEVSDKLRRQGRFRSAPCGKKRTRVEHSEGSESLKRRRLSTAQVSDTDNVDDGDEDGGDYEVSELPTEAGWHDNFPAVPGVMVKRTAVGTERSAEDDASPASNASTEPPTPAQTPTVSNEASKKRGGWPKGRPREPRPARSTHERSVGDGVVPLLSLLFYPQLIIQHPSGTIGSLSAASTLVSSLTIDEDTPVGTSRSNGAAAGPATVLGKRSAEEMDDVADDTTSLLMKSEQTVHGTTGTFGTNSIVQAVPHAGDAGRGKRVKKSTEKAFSFPKTPKAASASGRTPTKRSVSSSKSHLVDDPEGLVSTEYKDRHPEETWHHRGQGRWARVLPRSDGSPKTVIERSDIMTKGDSNSKPDAAPQPSDSSVKAPTFSKSPSLYDPADLMSTDYVNSHPGETWHHRGQGRWARGLPPPGATYKTAVKGPDAAAYLARIGTSEGKAKTHGAVVDGLQMKRNGEPWKNQPVTVNGVRLKPLENGAHSSHVKAQLRPLTPGGVPTVQYEVPPPKPASQPSSKTATGPLPLQPTLMTSSKPVPTTPSNGQVQRLTPAPRLQPISASTLQQRQISATPAPTPPVPTVKRKRPYTYKSRKQLSTAGLDGVPVELDRASDDDYTQTSSPKRQRKESKIPQSPAKTKYSIGRKKLSTAVALVRNLAPAGTVKGVPWDLVGLALQASDKGAAAELQYRSITHHAPHAKFVTALQDEMQEPFLAALEKGELPHVDHTDLNRCDWPGLVQWAERNVVPLVTEETLKNAKKSVEMHQPVEKTPKVQKVKISRPIVDSVPLFPASYVSERKDKSSSLDLNENLIMAKSWIRANSATKDNVYNTAQATEKLTALGTPILQAVNEMQESSTIRQLKKGRQRPGRNFEITQHVWEQFASWPGATDGQAYLRNLADERAKIVQHFEQNDTLQIDAGASEQETLILGSMLAQGMLKMEVSLPARNDDIEAPFPKLNAWSYGGARHDTRKIDRAIFDLPVVYTKTAAFSAEHSLNADVPVPSAPPPLPGEALPRAPFWIDIHENIIPDIWETVLSSIIYSVFKRPGITAKGIEKAHSNKLWAWEIELALEWMEQVGIAERFGGGNEVEGAWRGGWTVGEEWYCALTPEVATEWCAEWAG